MNSNKHYLIVDLDGTLTPSDTLEESIISFIKKNPIKNFFIFLSILLKGKENVKEKMSKNSLLEFENLNFSREVISIIKKKKEEGSIIILCSASHQRQVSEISEKLKIFDYAFGSRQNLSLKGLKKIEYIKSHFEMDSFSYIGNSVEDIPIWKISNEAYVYNKNIFFRVKDKDLKKNLIFLTHKISFFKKIKSLFKAIRLYQWVKNFLIFVPMMLAANFGFSNFFSSAVAFFSFSLISSSVYIFNDIFDIHKDRIHPRKKERPITNGEISIFQSFFIFIILISFSFLISISFLPISFFWILLSYIILNFFYSFYFKKLTSISLFILSFFYSLRIYAGGEATNLDISIWLISFSFFFFLGLSSIKRLGELTQLSENEIIKADRGFKSSDINFLKIFSLLTGSAGCFLLAVYLFSNQALEIYTNPFYLLFIPFITLAWFLNIYKTSVDGKITDDPIVFAIKDRLSILMGTLVLFFFILAL
ncbi:MAG: UbiA family prenyltransferase [Gammaproteobacteria bacterium]|nr:MAG: UbiA family prenyltransferase [Gammaproteobacteria bacterium]